MITITVIIEKEACGEVFSEEEKEIIEGEAGTFCSKIERLGYVTLKIIPSR